jgi:hypothetical protein
LRRSVALCVAVFAVAGCGDRAVTLQSAAGSDWPQLDTGTKTRIAKSCIRNQATAGTLSPSARRALLRSDPLALVARLNLYYRDAGPNSDAVAVACRLTIQQRYAPVVRITKLTPGTVMAADERFLRIEGTVTRGAGVHLRGGERSMPAFVAGKRFKGSIEVAPGRHRIYALATFPGSQAASRPIVVRRIVSVQNRRDEQREEKRAQPSER